MTNPASPEPATPHHEQGGGHVAKSPWTHSTQVGVPAHCFCAQVWDADGVSVATIEPTTDPADATATARLFAAAPDLLEALREARLFIEDERANRLEGFCCDEDAAYVDRPTRLLVKIDSALSITGEGR